LYWLVWIAIYSVKSLSDVKVCISVPKGFTSSAITVS
jgi:hypothetical protein